MLDIILSETDNELKYEKFDKLKNYDWETSIPSQKLKKNLFFSDSPFIVIKIDRNYMKLNIGYYL